MNIHEHQAKEILKEFGATVSNGVVIYNLNEINEKIKNKINKLSSIYLIAKGSCPTRSTSLVTSPIIKFLFSLDSASRAAGACIYLPFFKRSIVLEC